MGAEHPRAVLNKRGRVDHTYIILNRSGRTRGVCLCPLKLQATGGEGKSRCHGKACGRVKR
jgi:hypothetical protein